MREATPGRESALEPDDEDCIRQRVGGGGAGAGVYW